MSRFGWCLGVILSLCLPGTTWAAPAAKTETARNTGKCVSPDASLLARQKPDGPWQAVRSGATVTAGSALLALPGSTAEVDFRQGAVRLALVGLLPGGFPVLESAVRLEKDATGDLDLTLERGRIQLANRGKKGPVNVRVRFVKDTWDLELAEPGTEVIVQRSSSWAPGALPVEPAADRQPVTEVVLVVLKGRVSVGDGSELRAVEGLTLFRWNSRTGPAGPVPLTEVPAALKPQPRAGNEDGTGETDAVRLRRRLAAEPVADVLKEAINDSDRQVRLAAVEASGATDDLSGLLAALANARHPEVRAKAVVMLRHQMTLGGEQPPALYKVLRDLGYPAAKAETVLYLLQSFSEAARAQPETYDSLIDYLQHADPRVRELAAWQLYRLVPQGRDIAYNAAATVESRAEARAAWRRLIPSGQLPPKEKDKER